jgi:tetratricopeptide (TPR) repeat protein
MIGQQPLPESTVRAEGWDQRWRVAGLCLVLAAMTFAVFSQTLRHEFVNYDDDHYVYENPVVARGLTLKGIVWVFTHSDCSLYHPLTMLSLMADYQLYGLHAGGYHFTNLLLHTATVILLFLILRQMTGALWRSAFVAAVFAIHPLRVESVAWVAERKDVLSAFFFMLTLGAYARYVRKPDSLARYLVVAAAFVLALLSKPTVVTLPFVLLLLDYWPLRRFEQPRKLSGLLLEKIPLLALAAWIGARTVQAAGTALADNETISMPMRIGNALVSYAVHLRQIIWPEGLAVFYPRPEKGYSVGTMAFCFLLLALITGGVLAFRRKRPWLLTGWFWYLGVFAPMIGFVQLGAFAHADRMTLLPQIGIYVAVTWLVAEWRVSRVVFGGLMAGVLAVLMVCAWKQTTYWQNSEVLWTRALACTTGNFVAHLNLGKALQEKGRVDEAVVQFQKVLEIKPHFAQAHYDLGIVLCQKGRMDEGIAQFQLALQFNPAHGEAHNNLGNALLQKGRVDEAITQYQQALQLNPAYGEARNNLGNALCQKGRMDEGITLFQQALQLNPAYGEARNNLGNALLQKGRVDEAIAQFQQALQINPGYAEAHNNLGNALLQKGRVDEAITQFQQALQLNPAFAAAHNNLGNALLKKGRVDEAITQYQRALQFNPASAGIRNNLEKAVRQKQRRNETIVP